MHNRKVCTTTRARAHGRERYHHQKTQGAETMWAKGTKGTNRQAQHSSVCVCVCVCSTKGKHIDELMPNPTKY